MKTDRCQCSFARCAKFLFSGRPVKNRRRPAVRPVSSVSYCFITTRSALHTEPLITHTYPLKEIAAAYDLFENRRDGVMKVAIE